MKDKYKNLLYSLSDAITTMDWRIKNDPNGYDDADTGKLIDWKNTLREFPTKFWSDSMIINEKDVKYLVRPHDFHIFDVDESNGCFRSYSSKYVNTDGTIQQAMSHFTYKNLTENYGYFPINESEIDIYEKKNDEYHKYIMWSTRSDGHGGSKGGTMKEFLKLKKY